MLVITESVVLFIVNLLRNITNLAQPQNPGICMYVYNQSTYSFYIISTNPKILESVNIYMICHMQNFTRTNSYHHKTKT